MKTACLFIAVTLLQGTAHAQSVADFYADRTVTILVGSGAGGATDISARVIARHLGQHIPGTPTVIAQNMPGGGGVTMTNHVYRSAAKDGTILGYSLPGVITAQLLEPSRTRYDGRNLNWIGSALKYTGIISVIDSAPATSIAEAQRTELFIGTTGREKALVDFIEIGSRLGWPLFAPPDVPAERVEALRRAFEELTQGAEFAAAFEATVKGRLNPSTGSDVANFVSQALETPEGIVLETKRILGLEE